MCRVPSRRFGPWTFTGGPDPVYRQYSITVEIRGATVKNAFSGRIRRRQRRHELVEDLSQHLHLHDKLFPTSMSHSWPHELLERVLQRLEEP